METAPPARDHGSSIQNRAPITKMTATPTIHKMTWLCRSTLQPTRPHPVRSKMYLRALISFSIVFSGFAVTAYASSKVAHSKLGSYDWSVDASPNLANKPPSRKIVEDFIDSLQPADSGDVALEKEAGVYVCSFRFADLRHDGSLSLVFGIGIKDRPSCRAVGIVDKTKLGFESYGSGGAIGAGGDVSDDIEDLNHDGHLEFLLQYGLATFPQRCAANWTAIYAWTGANYTNVSDQFKDFYRHRLDQLNKIIPALQPTRGANGYELSDKECLGAETSAIEIFLGVSPDAGLDQAIRLTNSDDRLARQFGTILLIQIGGPNARTQLQKLVHDSDYGVATYAKNGLSKPVKIKFAPASFQRGNR